MSYPWASFGGFQFDRSEAPIWGTDAGWNLAPSFARSRPVGSATDVISAISIGSAERSFEIHLTPVRLTGLILALNTRALLTDWGRPVPDSRMAFLSEITSQEEAVSQGPLSRTGSKERKYRVRLTFVSA